MTPNFEIGETSIVKAKDNDIKQQCSHNYHQPCKSVI